MLKLKSFLLSCAVVFATACSANSLLTVGAPGNPSLIPVIPVPPTDPTLSIDSVTVGEDVGNATFTVTASATNDVDMTVQYVSSDVTATGGQDYTPVSGTSTITIGNTTTTITVPITDDVDDEIAETFNLVLSNPTEATIASGTGVGTITDNDEVVVSTVSGQWTEHAGTSLRSVDTCPANDCTYYQGTNLFFDGLTQAWSGGAWDTIQNRMVLWGGGHTGNYDNGAYYHDLTGGKGVLTQPSTNLGDFSSGGGPNQTGLYADGRPVARHTYNHCQFIISLNQLRCFGGYGRTPIGNGDGLVWYLDFDDATPDWTQGTPLPNGSLVLGYTVYNAVTDKVYVHQQGSGGNMWEWEPSTDTYTSIGASKVFSPFREPAAALDTTRNAILVLGTVSNTQGRYVQLNSDLTQVSTTNLASDPRYQSGAGLTLVTNRQYGMDYDPVNDIFVAWLGGQSVYIIDADTLDVSTYTPASGPTPPNPLPDGTYNRFRYASNCQCFVLSNDVDDNLWSISFNTAATADWTTRSTAAGVLMATNFDTQAEVDDWVHPDATAARVSWDQTHKLTGGGALRMDKLNTDGAASGSWRRWLANDEREFDDGDVLYVSFRQYFPHEFSREVMLNGGGFKQSIISRNATSMDGVTQDCTTNECGSNQLNEVVFANNSNRGLVQGYNRDFNGSFPGWDVSASTACSGSDFIMQNNVDRGVQSVGTACENDRARYGGLYSYGSNTGDPDPLTGARAYPSNGWMSFLIRVEFGVSSSTNTQDTLIDVWVSENGEAWDHIIDRNDIDLGNGPLHNTLWLLPYNTGTDPDAGRPDTCTLYDEVIVSTIMPAAPASGGPAYTICN